ncbi:hypothetical protein LCGC14_2184530 [marine sediment metagenome]|uniref:Uncharacterized protein n=1 Tax=marine sediment metagenome TaxID=412755 RepID=A0A0F9DLB6_9ZZZZ
MEKIIFLILSQLLNDADLQDKAAQAVAEFLANRIPDVAEDTVGEFVAKVGDKLTAYNP